MKRPSFQFYPGDWQSNSNLRRCSHAEKGIWIDVMCLLHDQEEYGIVRWPLKEIAQAVNCSMAALKGIVSKGILKGAEPGQKTEAFVYVPRSGRKDGDPVTLVEIQDGPIWYSSRMVKDEYVRTIRGESSRFGATDGDSPKDAPKPPFGDGSSSSSPSSASASTHTPSACAKISMTFRKYTISANPSHPSVIALAEQGVDLETLDACCKEARDAKPNESISIGYIVKKLEGWKAQASAIKVGGAQKPKSDQWFVSPQAMSAKARELGIADARPGESEAQFKARIQYALSQKEVA